MVVRGRRMVEEIKKMVHIMEKAVLSRGTGTGTQTGSMMRWVGSQRHRQ